MKKLLLLLIIALLFSCNGNDKKNENDLNDINLNGNVKSVTEFYFDVEEKFGEEVEVNLNKNSFTSFNKEGNIIERIYYYNDGATITKNKYDENGSITEKAYYDEYDEERQLLELVKYKNDDNGNMIELNSYNTDGELVYNVKCKNDNNGNIIERNGYNIDDELQWFMKLEYDDKGNNIKFSEYKSDGELKYVGKKKYDDKGNMIERNMYNEDGKLESYVKIIYNDKGNPIEYSKYNEKDELERLEKYELLLFDDKNWIKAYKETYNYYFESTTYKHVKREIIYY